MKFKDLLNKYTTKEILKEIKKIFLLIDIDFDSFEKNYYSELIKEIKELNPISSIFIIYLKEKGKYDDEFYFLKDYIENNKYEILGYRENGNFFHDISHIRWEEWLGSECNIPENISELYFLVRVIFQMTLLGISNKDVENSFYSAIESNHSLHKQLIKIAMINE